MKSNYSYPSVFKYSNNVIEVSFPDLPGCYTFGNSEDEAFNNARESLEGFLYYLEEDNDKIPTPRKINSIQTKDDEVLTLIHVWMVPVRDEMQNKHVKKTLTIPKWLNEVGIQKKVNFSRLLQSAIKEYLNIEKSI